MNTCMHTHSCTHTPPYLQLCLAPRQRPLRFPGQAPFCQWRPAGCRCLEHAPADVKVHRCEGQFVVREKIAGLDARLRTSMACSITQLLSPRQSHQSSCLIPHSSMTTTRAHHKNPHRSNTVKAATQPVHACRQAALPAHSHPHQCDIIKVVLLPLCVLLPTLPPGCAVAPHAPGRSSSGSSSSGRMGG